MSERRFTDEEVALILRRATDLDRKRAARPDARGLSLHELQEIGREAGIPAELIERAVREMEPGGDRGGNAFLDVPAVNRVTHALAASLDREQLGALVRLVDERLPVQGTVTEALGSVRWRGEGKFLGYQVSLEPGEDETVVRVEERYPDRFRRGLHLIPTAYAGFLGWAFTIQGTGSGMGGVVVGVMAAAVVWVLARLVWIYMAGRSRGRVHELAAELAETARRLAGEAGEVEPEGQPASVEPGGDEPGTG